MQAIGLTGGIATGKSTVSAILQEAGAIIIDADEIARKLVKKGLPAYQEIVDHFLGTVPQHQSGVSLDKMLIDPQVESVKTYSPK